ncbi:MAG: ornithine cyclodeaminase family protein [Chloroflexi bacterium]|nr:ornithine cyclodeaminase family protein [Chloroflexota bacterium]
MLRYVTDEEARGLISLDEGIELMHELFRQEAAGETENHSTVELALGKGFFRLKAGAAYGMGCYGFKAYGNGRYTVFLYGTESGHLEGIVECHGLTEVRTAAVSALGAKLMARADAQALGIIGTGREARAQLPGMLKVRPITSVKAYSRSAEHRERFAAEMSDRYGVPVTAVDSGEECVRDADLVVTITGANEPVLLGRWLRPGTHVCAIGATTPQRRELDEEAIARAGTIVVEHLEGAKAELGELQFAAARGKLRWGRVRELKDVAAGLMPGRTSDDEITIIDTIGVGSEDVAIAWAALSKARANGVGQELPL